ncbi:uncharacterized protein N7473_011197 [Penicillium subrubescens]|uniref:uncharacterized protein n=1 Tax=Penicillium subrubescens TaxID=1316194 RepID=UPI002545359C|nr:uncharacterized protein N7473_011197 [Penicillium subrubescens]KAJ5882763.1 hypothetical protein N7473_011197 [Penicillium subrubescens]
MARLRTKQPLTSSAETQLSPAQSSNVISETPLHNSSNQENIDPLATGEASAQGVIPTVPEATVPEAAWYNSHT